MKTLTLKRSLHVAILPAILICAFLLRFALSPMQGLDFDIGVNQGWARSAVELGLARSYTEQVGGNMLPNYPPFSLMIFAATGHIYKTVISPDYDTSLLAHRMMIKFPAILADVLLCLSFAVLIGRWRGRKYGLMAAAVFALHPAAIYESAVWGQTDSIFTLFIVASLIALLWEAPGIAGGLITLALLTKMQTIAVLPLFAVLYLLKPKWIPRGLIGSVVVLALVLLPFALGGTLNAVWGVYSGSVGYYPIVSSAAYNFWWSLLADDAWSKQDSELLFGIISFRNAGILIVATIMATTLWMLRQRLKSTDGWARQLIVLFSISSLFALAFFLFMTEMHERYLYPFIALGLPLAFLSVEGAVLYGFISLLYFLNLLGFLPVSPIERALHDTFRSFDVFLASALFFLFILYWKMTLQFRRVSVLAKIPSAVIGKSSRRTSILWKTIPIPVPAFFSKKKR